MPKVKELLALDAEVRNRLLAADPAMKHQFSTSVTYYTKGPAGFIKQSPQGPTSFPAGPYIPQPRVPPFNGPHTPGQDAQIRPPAGSNEPAAQYLRGAMTGPQQGGLANSSAAQQGRPYLSYPPPPEPVEPEDERRHRKFAQFLKEMAQGMEYEFGVKEVLSEMLDAFVEEAVTGSASLAKHRQSTTIGVKDLAFFLDRTYGINVPGFNVQAAERAHIQPEAEQKRAKLVAPKIARLGRVNGVKGDD